MDAEQYHPWQVVLELDMKVGWMSQEDQASKQNSSMIFVSVAAPGFPLELPSCLPLMMGYKGKIK